MNVTHCLATVSLTALILTGCTDAQIDGAKGQAAKKLDRSPEVQLTEKGKSMRIVANLPVAFNSGSGEGEPGNDRTHFGSTMDCTIESSTFTAKVTIPKKMVLPSYGKATPPMKVSCVRDTDKTGKPSVKTVKPVNLTAQAYSAAAAGHVLIGFGLVGAAVTGATAANRDKSQDVWGYPTNVDIPY